MLCRLMPYPAIALAALFISINASSILANTPPQPGNRAQHVILISIDGLRPEFYLDERWPAPTIQQQARLGTHALTVESVLPALTYPSHVSMITGALPARHGIVYNSAFHTDTDTWQWMWQTKLIHSATIWEALHQIGKTSAAISWPVTVGAPIDYNLPEIWSAPGKNADFLTPMRPHVTPPGLLEEIEKQATGKLDAMRLSSDTMNRDQLTTAAAVYVLQTRRPALLALHLLAVDHQEHAEGRDGAKVRRAIASVDTAINNLIEATERAGIAEQTAFIVTGDHGFSDVHTTLAPNTLLVKAGLLETNRRHDNWRAAFHSGGGTTFLRLNNAHDDVTRIQILNLLSELPPGQRALFRIMDRSELDTYGAAPEDAFALTAIPGVNFSSDSERAFMTATKGGSHGYDPKLVEMQTGFVAWGAGITHGGVVSKMRLVDIAPLIADLLGVSFSAPDGVLLPGIETKEN